jgi:hypothetical protein
MEIMTQATQEIATEAAEAQQIMRIMGQAAD